MKFIKGIPTANTKDKIGSKFPEVESLLSSNQYKPTPTNNTKNKQSFNILCLINTNLY